MKPYDSQRAYMRQYFGSKYPYVVVLRGHLSPVWMRQNLKATYSYTVDNDMGRDYTQTIIGYGVYGVHNRPDENFHLFYDRGHLDQVIAAFPDMVVTTDPFGPDVCPTCRGVFEHPPCPKRLPRVTGWRRGAARLLGIPIR